MSQKRCTASQAALVLYLLAAARGFAFGQANVRFVDVSAERGIGPHEPDIGSGSSVAVVDYDRDGYLDIFVPQKYGVPDRLYRNLGDGSFADVAADVGLATLDRTRVAIWLDYDGDTLLDLFQATDYMFAPSTFRLFRQQTDGTFVDVTVEAGVFKPPFIVGGELHWGGICAGDINRDGFLDIYTGQWPGPAHLFLNTGRGGFIDISQSSGVSSNLLQEHQSIMADFNGDGWTDIYVALDFSQPNLLWINQKDNTFKEEALLSGLDNAMSDMGMALGDYDNDGDLDLYITNVFRPDYPSGPQYNVLYRNDSVEGTPAFTDVATSMGVDQGYWGWGTTFIDADNDGLLDIAATNGFRGEQWDRAPARLFMNTDGGQSAFTDHSDGSGFNNTDWGSALIAADFDRDGDLDLLQAGWGGALAIAG